MNSTHPSPEANRQPTSAAGLRAAPGSASWLPIETAPKDGRRVLLWRHDDELEIGYWSTSVWVSPGAWIIYEARSDTVELHPTHWMPLPTTPNAELSDARGAHSLK